MPRRPKSRPSAAEPAGVVRRPASERKQLAPELEALARGDEKRLRPPPRRPRLNDPRPIALVPGVANRDARLVLDGRLERLREALVRRPEDPNAAITAERELAQAVRLGVWRGRALTSFDAFAEQLLGLEATEARSLAQAGADRDGVALERCSDEAIALWMRFEAALLEAGVAGLVSIRGHAREERLHFEVPVDGGPEAIAAVGRRIMPLVRDRQGALAPRPRGERG